jgi:hypothetical protein
MPVVARSPASRGPLMSRVRFVGPAALLRLSVVALIACNAIAGIGAPILETSDASTGDSGTLDSAPPGDEGNRPDGGDNDGIAPETSQPDTNAPDTNAPDTSVPPPLAAKPGFDISAGGTYGVSASYRLIAVVGESPGGNNVGTSKNYVLKAGVIATTQPN